MTTSRHLVPLYVFSKTSTMLTICLHPTKHSKLIKLDNQILHQNSILIVVN